MFSFSDFESCVLVLSAFLIFEGFSGHLGRRVYDEYLAACNRLVFGTITVVFDDPGLLGELSRNYLGIHRQVQGRLAF